MSKNAKTLASFVVYCEAHPEQRFWQALRNWSGWPFIYASRDLIRLPEVRDTYYWLGGER